MFKFRINPEGREDNDNKLMPEVYIICENCATMHGLSDYAELEEVKEE